MANAKASQSSAKKLTLADLVNQARAKVETETFNFDELETKVASSGNVGFRVTTTAGRVITFWSSMMDEVVEETDVDGVYRLTPGTRIADDGGLIPASAKSGGFWS